MRDLMLVIGNKNYSSWSLRPWLALKAAGLPFREELILLRHADTKAKILAHSPAGKVPCLRHGDLVVWESLAICEYAADLAPQAGLWPADPAARAMARSAATEMHGGFAALRNDYPMDISRRYPGKPCSDAAKADIARIVQLWRDCRAKHGQARGEQGGPFLFGRFGIADCMYAPVVTRLRTYGVAVDAATQAYMDAVFDHPAMREWCEAAAQEPPLPDAA